MGEWQVLEEQVGQEMVLQAILGKHTWATTAQPGSSVFP